MTKADKALTLMAEAAAHSIEIIFSNRELGITTQRSGNTPALAELLDDIDAHANEIWAILYGYRRPML